MTMTPTLFVAPTALRPSHRLASRRAVCSRRRASSACTKAVADNGSENNTDGSNSAAAWAAWQRTRSVPEEEAESAPIRDPDAETDFWRGAARELGSTTSTAPRSQREVWADARDVTTGVDELQSRLADELQTYDPNAAVDDYRDAAREIVRGGADAPAAPQWAATWGNSSTPRWNADAAAEAASDAPSKWNPDAAWGGDVPSPGPFDYASADPPAQPYPRRATGGATYGEDPALDALADEWREEAGFQTRDPAEETDFWRGAARELVSELPTGNVEPVVPVSDAPAPPTPVTEGTRASSWGAPFGSGADLRSEVTDEPTDESSAWAAFSDANERWKSTLGLENGAATGSGDNDWGEGDWRLSDEKRWRAWDSAVAPKQVPRADGGAKAGSLGDDTQMWMQAARQMGTSGDAQATSQTRAGPPKSTGEQGDGIAFWAAAAREMTPPVVEDGLEEQDGTGEEGAETRE